MPNRSNLNMIGYANHMGFQKVSTEMPLLVTLREGKGTKISPSPMSNTEFRPVVASSRQNHPGFIANET